MSKVRTITFQIHHLKRKANMGRVSHSNSRKMSHKGKEILSQILQPAVSGNLKLTNKEIRHRKEHQNNSLYFRGRAPKKAVSKHLSSQDRKLLIKGFYCRIPKNCKTFKNKVIANRVSPMNSKLNK